MPVSHKLKTIFVHIPKNAGESIERTLKIYGGDPLVTFWGVIDNRYVLQHLTANELKSRHELCEVWDEYFKFAVIRNPWSRAVSEYNWYLRYGPIIPFCEWVYSLENRLIINNSINIFEIGHNIEQYKFVDDKGDNLIVDKLIQFENLNADFTSLSHEKKWDVQLIKASTTSTKNDMPFYDYYDEKSALKISEIYSRDIEIFGYNIDDTFSINKFRDKPLELDEFFDEIFDEKLYLDANPDVKEAGVNAYQHYIEYGIKEGRKLR